MKLTRRNALMAAVGSIFGGKDAAKSVLSEVGLAGGEAVLKGGYGPVPKGETHLLAETPNVVNPKEQIKIYKGSIEKLKKLIDGDLYDWQKERLNDFSEINYRSRMFEIDNFKSLSAASKLRMIDRINKEEMRKRWIEEAKNEIKHYSEMIDHWEKQIATFGGLLPSTNNSGIKEYHGEKVRDVNYPKASRG